MLVKLTTSVPHFTSLCNVTMFFFLYLPFKHGRKKHIIMQVIGGEGSLQTFIFDFVNPRKNWTEGPTLNIARNRTSCAKIRKGKVSTDWSIIVVGLSDTGTTVEISDDIKQKYWSLRPGKTSIFKFLLFVIMRRLVYYKPRLLVEIHRCSKNNYFYVN